MTATELSVGAPASMGLRRRAPQFPAHHRSDNTFFLVLVGLMWLGILMGFVPEIMKHIRNPTSPYPLIVHVHAVLFVGWLCLLTTQVLLARNRNMALHRKLGGLATYMVPAMVVVGVLTAVVVDRLRYQTQQVAPAFFSVQLGDLILFGLLAGSGIALRRKPAAHKRLMLLATLCIVDAGFSRWWADGLEHLFGHGYWSNVLQLFLGNMLLIAALGAYDLLTRHRLHRAYVYAATLAISGQLLLTWLYLRPAWKPIALTLIGY